MSEVHNLDIKCIVEQERLLRFGSFDEDAAWGLGLRLRELARERSVAVTIEVRLGREQVFLCAMPGTTASNADWARRKRNTAELLGRSSYLAGLEFERDGKSLEGLMGLPTRDYAKHGGAFPIKLTGGLCIGVVTVSGLPERDDHLLIVEVLAELCGITFEQVNFPT
jgi:uncharacterized protein (UPF0303 family)